MEEARDTLPFMRGRPFRAGAPLVLAVALGCAAGTRPPRGVALSTFTDGGPPGSPCARARELRLRVETLIAEGLLDRASRALSRARDLCPSQAALAARAEARIATELASHPGEGDALLKEGLAKLAAGDRVAGRRALDRAAAALEKAAGAARVVDLTNGPSGALRVARYSPKGDTIAIAHGQTISIYAGLAISRTLRAHTDLVGTLCFSPDGTQLATGSRDKTVRVWDLATGNVVRTIVAHDAPIASIAWHGPYIATASHDKSARVFRAADGAPLLEIKGPSAMTAVAFSPDGRLAIGGLDRRVRIVDVPSGDLVRTVATLAGITSLAYGPNGHLAIGTTDARVFVVDGKTGWAVATLLGHSEHITDVAFSKDGTALASASADATARIWEPGVGYACRKTLEGHVARVTAVSFDPNTARIATASEDRALLLWDSQSGTHIAMIGAHADPVTAVAVAADRTIATGSRDATVRIVRGAPYRVTMLAGHVAAVGGLAFSPDSQLLASAADDNTVRTWNAADGTSRDVLRGHKAAVSSVAISPDGKMLASGARDGTLRVVDPRTGILLFKRRHHPAIESVAFSADNQVLATGGVDGTIDVGPPLGPPTLTFRHWSEPILALSFVDLMSLASGSLDGSVGVFSILDGTRLSIDDSHKDGVTGVAFVRDELVSSSGDGTVRFAGRTIHGHEEAVLSLAMLDNDRVVTGGEDGSVRIFHRDGAFLIGMRALRRSSGTWTFTADGYFDAHSEARAVATCRIGAVHYPIELCEERYAVNDLWSRVLRSDGSFRDP
jgi:WD40 repeat protein